MEWSGVEWSGVEWSGVEWSGVEWSGVEWSGVEWSGVEWSGVWYRAHAAAYRSAVQATRDGPLAMHDALSHRSAQGLDLAALGRYDSRRAVREQPRCQSVSAQVLADGEERTRTALQTHLEHESNDERNTTIQPKTQQLTTMQRHLR